MENGIFSKEILNIICKNIKIFAVTTAILFIGAGWKILSVPDEYRALSYLRYMGEEPGEITVKKDSNGTVTLIQYRLGEGNLDLQTLFRTSEFVDLRGENLATLTFDRGNGNHVLEVRGRDREEILGISEKYMEKFLEKNREFLQEKSSNLNFPLFIKAQETERIESRKSIYLFFAFLTSIFIGIISAFIAQVLKEIRGRE